MTMRINSNYFRTEENKTGHNRKQEEIDLPIATTALS